MNLLLFPQTAIRLSSKLDIRTWRFVLGRLREGEAKGILRFAPQFGQCAHRNPNANNASRVGSYCPDG